MKNKDFEKYITELSPELQEKARQCANMDELNKLLAENDVELSEDALEAIAGGGGTCTSNHAPGDETGLYCPECVEPLYFKDRTPDGINRYYCGNSACKVCQENWLFVLRGYRLERVQ